MRYIKLPIYLVLLYYFLITPVKNFAIFRPLRTYLIDKYHQAISLNSFSNNVSTYKLSTEAREMGQRQYPHFHSYILLIKILEFCLLILLFFTASFLVFRNSQTHDFMFQKDFPLVYWFFNANLGFLLESSISKSFCFLASFICCLCLIGAKTSIGDQFTNPKDYLKVVFYILLLNIALIFSFATTNLLLFFISFEFSLIPMYLIINSFGSRFRKIRASYFFLLYTILGSIFFLFVVLYLYYTYGSLDYQFYLTRSFDLETQKILWLGLFLSFAVKVPMVPFHIWLPEAHVEAPTFGSMILAGLLLKLGAYGFLRFSITLFPEASIYFSPLIFVMGTIGVIYASLIALSQTDIKKVIAYSSIAHMNLVIVGLFSMTVDGINGAIFQMISHAFVSCGLFFLVGVIYNRYGTRLIYYFSGLNHIMPLFSFFFLIFSLANISLPMTSSFVGEFLLFVGIAKKDFILVFILLSSLVLGGLYMLWLFNRICYGNLNPDLNFYGDLTVLEFFVLIFLSILILGLGIKPDFIINYNLSEVTSIVQYYYF